jgi:hypothetical protein
VSLKGQWIKDQKSSVAALRSAVGRLPPGPGSKPYPSAEGTPRLDLILVRTLYILDKPITQRLGVNARSQRSKRIRAGHPCRSLALLRAPKRIVACIACSRSGQDVVELVKEQMLPRLL